MSTFADWPLATVAEAINPDYSESAMICLRPPKALLRQRVVDHCAMHGVPLRTEDHGFTPHMTLGFEDETPSTIPRLPAGDNTATFDSLWLVWGEEWQEIRF